MLTIMVQGQEFYDEQLEEFVTVGDFVLQLEHSLVSLSKWESIHEKSFLGREEKTSAEVLDYVRLMILTPFPSDIFDKLSNENLEEINDYINEKQTATWFSESKGKGRSGETITAELIYYWMVSFNIPMECQHWHLNRLLTLIRVFNAKQEKPKKMSKSEILAKNRELNAQRRQQMGTRG